MELKCEMAATGIYQFIVDFLIFSSPQTSSKLEATSNATRYTMQKNWNQVPFCLVCCLVRAVWTLLLVQGVIFVLVCFTSRLASGVDKACDPRADIFHLYPMSCKYCGNIPSGWYLQLFGLGQPARQVSVQNHTKNTSQLYTQYR